MTGRVTIVECDVGNLFSIRQALEYWDAEVEITGELKRIEEADRLLLPGVGAFGDAMAEVRERGLFDIIHNYAQTGRPLMGICVGLQLLFELSHEFGVHEGLGLLRGEVCKMPAKAADGSPIRLPHIGWSDLRPVGQEDWEGTILSGIEDAPSMYFAHSYRVHAGRPADAIANIDVAGHAIMAAVQQQNIMGCQFHPEKSGAAGLKIMRNFLNI